MLVLIVTQYMYSLASNTISMLMWLMSNCSRALCYCEVGTLILPTLQYNTIIDCYVISKWIIYLSCFDSTLVDSQPFIMSAVCVDDHLPELSAYLPQPSIILGCLCML